MIETVRLEHVPATHVVYASFFRDVSNAEFLHSQLLARNSDFEYAFIDASSVISRLHILAAAYKALSVLLDGTLKTPNVHSEIVASLSASKNIADAYRRYGVSRNTRDVVILKVIFPTDEQPTPPSAAEVEAHLAEHVRGRPVALTDEELAACTDWAATRKSYKLSNAPALEGLPEGPSRVREMEMLALGGMALRGL